MVATIAKHFTFAASHQLPNHDGPCHDLHGHTYKLEVMVTGRVRQPLQEPAPNEGMVLDFAELKRVYAEHIEPRVDHKHLNDTLIDVLPHAAAGPVPTSENIAAWIWSVFNGVLREPVLPERRITIRLWESPTSYAEFGPMPWRGAQ